jgi:hypothetical protein
LVLALRAMVIDPDRTTRRSVLRGGFNTGKVDSWKAPSSMMAVFVSSTFTDTKLERGYLIDDLLFKLRKEADKHGKCVRIHIVAPI